MKKEHSKHHKAVLKHMEAAKKHETKMHEHHEKAMANMAKIGTVKEEKKMAKKGANKGKSK